MTIDGFYDGIIELTDDERALFAKLPFEESAWLANARSETSYGEEGFSTLERVWARPTAEVNGIWGGYTDAGHKTIVPVRWPREGVVPAGRRPGAAGRAAEGRGLARRGRPGGHRVVDDLVRRTASGRA